MVVRDKNGRGFGENYFSPTSAELFLISAPFFDLKLNYL
jgi:hypothetical protein